MKKHSLLMLLPFSLIVTGCGGLKKGSIFNEKFMRANFGDKVEKAYEFVTPVRANLALEGTFSDPYFPTNPNTGTQHKYLMFLRQGEKSGYFSVVENKFVLPLDNYYESGSSVKTATGFDLLFLYNFKFDEENKRTSYLYDEYGNEIFVGENGTNGDGGKSLWIYNETSFEAPKGSDVKTLIKVCKGTQYNNVPVAFAYYTVDAKLKEVISAEEYYKRNPYMAMKEQSLAQYGHPELTLLFHNSGGAVNYYVLNTEKQKYVSTFSTPASLSVIAFSDYIYYQVEKNPHEREDKSYTYYDGTNKVSLETYRVNYLTGKEEKIKTDFVLNTTVSPTRVVIKDEKGNKSLLFLANTRQIEKDKSLSSIRRSVILDKNLKEVADLGGIDFQNIKPFGDKYWTVKNIVYDSKLKEVGYLPYLTNVNTPRIALEGGYGLVDYTGKYIVNPSWGMIQKLEIGEYYYASNSKVHKIFKVEDEKAIEVASLDLEKYTPFGATGSDAHMIVQNIETSKEVVWDMRDGSFSDLVEPGTTDNSWTIPSVSAREGTLVIKGNIYKKDGSFFAITSATNITKSYVSSK
jgi:hypothetical protein